MECDGGFLQSGIRNLLADTSSELDMLQWKMNQPRSKAPQKRMFRSRERLAALKLCCWGFDKNSDSLQYIDRLEAEEQRERAAAIAVFTLRMHRAIEVLNSGKTSSCEFVNELQELYVTFSLLICSYF